MRSEIVDSTEISELELCEQRMQEALARERRLRQLATNPLMCALLCALHRDRQTRLPRDRIEIYDAALEMLLERRDFERGVQSGIAELSRRRKTIILQALAYWLVRNGWSSGPRDRAIEQVGNCLATMSDVNTTPAAVLQSLLERSGVIREPTIGKVDFTHRTFQEYLAARAIVDAGELGVLIAHAHDDLWQEVVVLAVGYAGEAVRDNLLAELLALAKNASNEKRTRLHLVVLACLETAPQIEIESRKEIEKTASWLLPLATIAQAEAVAKAGEFGLELLMRQRITTAKQAVATIRAASLIGGDEALRLIESSCRQRCTESVKDELVRAWSRFDHEIYARDVLARTRFEYLQIQDPGKMSALRYIDVQSVSLEFTSGHGDISPLAFIPHLQNLNVRDPLLKDISPLRSCRELQSLQLWETGQVDLAELRDCTNLQSMDVDLNRVVSPNSLAFFNQLTTIQLRNRTNFARIRNLLPTESRLRRFGITQEFIGDDLNDMVADPRLAELDFLLLGNCFGLKDITAIRQWANTLSGIYLTAPKLTECDLLGELPKLSFANLTSVPMRDLLFVQNLPRLHLLHLGGTAKLPNLEPLQTLPALTFLFLYADQDIDLTPLKGKKYLDVRVRIPDSAKIRGAKLLGTGSKVRRMRW